MKNTILATLALAVCQTIHAQDTTTNSVTTTEVTTRSTVITLADDNRLYRAPELSIDGFGTASFRQQTLEHPSGRRLRHDTRLGAGAGVNFFFLRMLGVGADAWSEDTHHNFIDNVSGNLILRFPICESGIAPYIFGGGGYKFDMVPGKFAQGGAGIEFRFLPNIGIFVDGRWIFAHNIDDFATGRAGVRVAF